MTENNGIDDLQNHTGELSKSNISETSSARVNAAFEDDGNSTNAANNRPNADLGNSVLAASTPEGEWKGPKFWQHLVKNWAVISQVVAITIIFLLLWAAVYTIMPEYTTPRSTIMRIIFLFLGAQLSGHLVTLIKLPDMLGMLAFGVFYTNVGLADFSGYEKLEAFLREMALIILMLLAGFGLRWEAFKRLWFMITRLTLIPTVVEVATITLLAIWFLDMPWMWGVLLGCVITAVSPNVVVTVMLTLEEERLGLNDGIHTLIYAMTACNDVLSVFLFTTFLGIIFAPPDSSNGIFAEQLVQGPVGIGVGLVYGYLMGVLIQFLPSNNSRYLNGLRLLLTILAGTISVVGSRFIGYQSAGALGCVTVAFIAGVGWRRHQKRLRLKQQEDPEHREELKQKFYTNEDSSVPKRLDLIWKFLKPISFSLIGKEINIAILDAKIVGYGVVVVIVGSLFRLAFAYLSTYGGNLTKKERAYITISSFPKATVQAALGPIALDMARSSNSDESVISLASKVLVISVLAIIMTAPLGAVLMLRLAPVWLKRCTREVNRASTGGDITAITRDTINPFKFSQRPSFIKYRTPKTDEGVV